MDIPFGVFMYADIIRYIQSYSFMVALAWMLRNRHMIGGLITNQMAEYELSALWAIVLDGFHMHQLQIYV